MKMGFQRIFRASPSLRTVKRWLAAKRKKGSAQIALRIENIDSKLLDHTDVAPQRDLSASYLPASS
jgi:hypothetical protein